MGNYQNASGGLKKMYIAELGAIVCAVLSIIPLVNVIAAIAAIVFMVLSIVGLYCAGKDIPGCQKAFMVTIISLVVSVFKAIFKTGILSAIFAIAGDVTYSQVDNDLSATSSLGYGKFNSSVDTNVFSLGITAKYTFDTNFATITPHAGIRYTSLDADSLDVKSANGVIAKTNGEKIRKKR